MPKRLNSAMNKDVARLWVQSVIDDAKAAALDAREAYDPTKVAVAFDNDGTIFYHTWGKTLEAVNASRAGSNINFFKEAYALLREEGFEVPIVSNQWLNTGEPGKARLTSIYEEYQRDKTLPDLKMIGREATSNFGKGGALGQICPKVTRVVVVDDSSKELAAGGGGYEAGYEVLPSSIIGGRQEDARDKNGKQMMHSNGQKAHTTTYEPGASMAQYRQDEKGKDAKILEGDFVFGFCPESVLLNLIKIGKGSAISPEIMQEFGAKSVKELGDTLASTLGVPSPAQDLKTRLAKKENVALGEPEFQDLGVKNRAELNALLAKTPDFVLPPDLTFPVKTPAVSASAAASASVAPAAVVSARSSSEKGPMVAEPTHGVLPGREQVIAAEKQQRASSAPVAGRDSPPTPPAPRRPASAPPRLYPEGNSVEISKEVVEGLIQAQKAAKMLRAEKEGIFLRLFRALFGTTKEQKAQKVLNSALVDISKNALSNGAAKNNLTKAVLSQDGLNIIVGKNKEGADFNFAALKELLETGAVVASDKLKVGEKDLGDFLDEKAAEGNSVAASIRANTKTLLPPQKSKQAFATIAEAGRGDSITDGPLPPTPAAARPRPASPSARQNNSILAGLADLGKEASTDSGVPSISASGVLGGEIDFGPLPPIPGSVSDSALGGELPTVRRALTSELDAAAQEAKRALVEKEPIMGDMAIWDEPEVGAPEKKAPAMSKSAVPGSAIHSASATQFKGAKQRAEEAAAAVVGGR